MYRLKREHYRTVYSSKDCIHVIISKLIDKNITLGYPCLVTFRPFSSPENLRNSKKDLSPGFLRALDKQVSKSPKKFGQTDEKVEEDKKIEAKDLYDMDMDQANELLKNIPSRILATTFFSLWSDYYDIYKFNVRGDQLYFNKKVHFLFDDNFKEIELARLKEVYSDKELNNLAEIFLKDLETYRYINLTFRNLAASNKALMMEDVNIIFNSLAASYTNHECFYKYMKNAYRILLDTLSVSFYRLNDVIPVFDTRHTKGMVVEILLTNSEVNKSQIVDSDKAALARFIFSKSREGVFTIDGEPIKRPSSLPTSGGLNSVLKLLETSLPNDLEIKKSKSVGQEED